MKLKESRFRFDDGRKLFAVRVLGPGTGCAERLWMLHPWEHSRPGSIGPEQPELVGGCSGWNEMIFRVLPSVIIQGFDHFTITVHQCGAALEFW